MIVDFPKNSTTNNIEKIELNVRAIAHSAAFVNNGCCVNSPTNKNYHSVEPVNDVSCFGCSWKSRKEAWSHPMLPTTLSCCLHRVGILKGYIRDLKFTVTGANKFASVEQSGLFPVKME